MRTTCLSAESRLVTRILDCRRHTLVMCRLVESPHISLQLIYAWSVQLFCVESRPPLRLAIRVIFVASQTKTCKKSRFLPVLHSDTMSCGRIKNRKPRGESTHKMAFLMHRSIYGAANIQLLNWHERCGNSTCLHIRLACDRIVPEPCCDLRFWRRPQWMHKTGVTPSSSPHLIHHHHHNSPTRLPSFTVQALH